MKEKYRVSQENALSDLQSIGRGLSIPDHQINWWLEMKVRFWDTLYEKTGEKKLLPGLPSAQPGGRL